MRGRVRFLYDREPHSLWIGLKNYEGDEIADQVSVGPNQEVLVDLAQDGSVLGVDILFPVSDELDPAFTEKEKDE